MQQGSELLNCYSIIHEFIQNTITGDLRGINDFFFGLLNKTTQNTANYLELKRIYERLAVLNEPEMILENLYDLVNFITFTKLKQLEKNTCQTLILNHSTNETINLKLIKTFDNGENSKIFKKIRNYEYLGINFQGNPDTVNACLVFQNINGLVYILKYENILIGSKRLILKENFEIFLNENEKIEVLALNENSCELKFTGSGNNEQVKEFSKSCKDLKIEFGGLERRAGLKKRADGWVLKIVELDTMDKMFLKIKSEYKENSFFVFSGCQVILNNIKYIVKYSYS